MLSMLCPCVAGYQLPAAQNRKVLYSLSDGEPVIVRDEAKLVTRNCTKFHR